MARITQIGKSTIGRLCLTIKNSMCSCETLTNMTDDELLHLFYPMKGQVIRHKDVPDFVKIHERLSKSQFETLIHQWAKYLETSTNPYGYSRFVSLYHEWCKDNYMKPVLLMNEVPGQCMYVDWAGPSLEFELHDTGEIVNVYFFITSLGASQYIYCEPFPDMTSSSFIQGHINALKFYGGIPRFVVPDNCKTAVIKHMNKEFELNAIYEDLQEYYGYVVMPARPHEPTDKNDAELSVNLIEHWILSEMELMSFNNYDEIKKFVLEVTEKINKRPFAKIQTRSRHSWYLEVDKPALKALPQTDFVIYEYKTVNVPKNYHVQIPGDTYSYSVPYKYIKQSVRLKYSAETLKIYDLRNNFICEHKRQNDNKSHINVITNPDHRPMSHKIVADYRQYDSDYYLKEAEKIGPNTVKVIEFLLSSKKHPEQMYRACQGIILIVQDTNSKIHCKAGELETICAKALETGKPSYTTIKNLVKALKLDNKKHNKHLPTHDNQRGNNYE